MMDMAEIEALAEGWAADEAALSAGKLPPLYVAGDEVATGGGDEVDPEGLPVFSAEELDAYLGERVPAEVWDRIVDEATLWDVSRACLVWRPLSEDEFGGLVMRVLSEYESGGSEALGGSEAAATAIAATSSGDGDEAGGEAATGRGGESVLSDDEREARGLATAATLPQDGRVRWWELIAYEDSCPEDWEKRLSRQLGVRALCCWHRLDKKPDGSLKKAHLHVMAGDSHGRKWSRRQAERLGRAVFGHRPGGEDSRLVAPISSPSGYASYLIHANAPEKAQYAREDVLSFGGADFDLVAGVVDNKKLIVSEILRWSREFCDMYGCCPAFAALVRYSEAMRPAWARVLATRAGDRVMVWLRSVEFDAGVDGRGARTLELVEAIIRWERRHDGESVFSEARAASAETERLLDEELEDLLAARAGRATGRGDDVEGDHDE